MVRTETDNARADRFYRHLGFEPLGNSTEVVDGTEVEVVEQRAGTGRLMQDGTAGRGIVPGSDGGQSPA